jgi:hypothetical protein
MSDQHATPEDKLRAIRARLNEAPRDHQRPGGYCAINISDVRWMVHFIDAALLKEDGQDDFDLFATRAAAGHLGALVDMYRDSHAELVEALETCRKLLAGGPTKFINEALARAKELK